MNTIKTLVCSTCGKEKDIDEFQKCKHNTNGYHGKCKKCKTLYANEWRNKPKTPVAEKACKCCRDTKPAAEFTLDKSYKDGLSIYCRSCQKDKRVIKLIKE